MEQFGRYQLLEQVGKGGMAEVYRATTQVGQGLEKELVIKKILPKYAKDPDFASMFVNEARVALGLNHPNIVQVFDFGTVGEALFLAMELVEGLDLQEIIRISRNRKDRIPPALAAFIGQEVARGLDYAHRKVDSAGRNLGIIHCDVSPQNILVSWDGNVKLTDFGIARAAAIDSDEPGTLKGKLGYMSPEQARAKALTPVTDIYSLGLILLEMACGRPAFQKKDAELLQQVRAGAIPNLRSLNPAIPRSLEEIITKSLGYSPEDRYPTAMDFQRALTHFIVETAANDEFADDGLLANFMLGLVPPSTRRARHETIQFFDHDEPTTANRTPVERLRERKHGFIVHGLVQGLDEPEAAVLYESLKDSLQNIAYRHNAHIQDVSPTQVTLLSGVPSMSDLASTAAIQMAADIIDLLEVLGKESGTIVGIKFGIHWGKLTLSWRPQGNFECQILESDLEASRTIATLSRPSDVLVSDAAFRLCRNEWEFSELAKRASDTSMHPEVDKIYRLLGPRTKARRPKGAARFIPRPLYTRALRGLYQEVVAQRKKGQIVVAGEIGVGKKALVEQFLATIPQDEVSIVRARARVSTAYTPFAMFADYVRDLLDIDRHTSAEETEARLDRLLDFLYPGSDAQRILVMRAITKNILGLPVEESVALDSVDKRRYLVDAILQVERRFRPGKVLILVAEDLHWCDAESREIFKSLLSEPSNRPVLGIGTSRIIEELLAELRGTDVRLIVLPELSTQETTLFLKSLFERSALDDDDLKDLAERVGGNPLFIGELMEDWLERGLLTRSEETGLFSVVEKKLPRELPSTIESLIAQRIDRLSPGEKKLIAAAAVLGRSMEKDLLLTLSKATPDSLNTCVEKGLLRYEDTRIAFPNELVMRVAYGQMPPDVRRDLHREAVRYFRSSKYFRVGHDEATAARHLELAEDNTLAAAAYLVASEYAVRVGGVSDALRLVERALRLLPETDSKSRFHAYSLREPLIARSGKPAEHLRTIREMIHHADRLGDVDLRAQATLRLADFYLKAKRPDHAAEALEDADALLANSDSGALLAQAMRHRAELSFAHGDTAEALGRAEEALTLANNTKPATLRERAQCLSTYGRVLWSIGQLASSIVAYGEALVICRSLGHIREESEALHEMGTVFAALGEYEEALAHYKSAIKLDQDIGDSTNLAIKLANVGQAYVDLGDLKQAETYLRKALALAKASEDPALQARVIINIGQMHLQRNNPTKAIEVFQRGHKLALDSDSIYQRVRAQVYWAWALLDANQDAERAYALARASVSYAQSRDFAVARAYGLAIAGIALARLGRRRQAIDACNMAVQVRDELPRPEGEEQIQYLRARALRRCDDMTGYRQALHKSHEEIQRKAKRLTDPELRQIYETSRLPSSVDREMEELEQQQEQEAQAT